MQIPAMRINPDVDFSHLTAAQRIQLAQDLWESLEPGEIEAECLLTKEQQTELDRRLEDLARNPDAGLPWDEVRARIGAHLDEVERQQRAHHDE